MASTRVAVECGCGWKGRRVARECACYDEYALYCMCRWGRCPREGCVGRVTPTVFLRELRAQQAASDAWWEEHGAEATRHLLAAR